MKITELISASVSKFQLDLNGYNVLTEAASGNYVVTPLIAALGGANVIAFAKDSEYGTFKSVKVKTEELAKKLGISERITVLDDFSRLNLKNIDILTNTGFLRPIDEKFISRLSDKCVIPLMWEPWEFRKEEIDLQACIDNGIKIYGTDENHDLLKTFDYIGEIILHFLKKYKKVSNEIRMLLIGCDEFIEPVQRILNQSEVLSDYVSNYNGEKPKFSNYDVIVFLEHRDDILLLGKNGYINRENLSSDQLLIHICGNIDIVDCPATIVPEKPAEFGWMSFRTDYLNPLAVVELHTAGLKVAEGMLKAKKMYLEGVDFKNFMEAGYPALAFENPQLW